MHTLTYTIHIDAPRKTVWNTMLDDETYRQWTSVFAEGSHAETDWQEGSRALFLSPEGDGMVSRIAKNIPHEYLSIEHLGMIENGVEDTESEKVKQWQGVHENYTLTEAGGGTDVLIELEIDEQSEYKDMFEETWPKALEKLKEIAESRAEA